MEISKYRLKMKIKMKIFILKVQIEVVGDDFTLKMEFESGN